MLAVVTGCADASPPTADAGSPNGVGAPDSVAPTANTGNDAGPGMSSSPDLAAGAKLDAGPAPILNERDSAPAQAPRPDGPQLTADDTGAGLPDEPVASPSEDAFVPAAVDATPTSGQDADSSPTDTIPAAEPGVVTGSVTGLPPSVMATVILGNDGFLVSQKVSGGGTYRFTDIPDGTYFLKVQTPGYDAGPARQIVMARTPTPLRAATPLPAPQALPASQPQDFNFTSLPTNQFKYHWQEDVSRGGYETTAHIVQPPQITFLDQPVDVPELAAADTLNGQYAVVLSNEEQSWNTEFSYRLLETMRSVPQAVRKNAGEQNLRPSKWILTNRHIVGDVELDYGTDGTTVTISADAFVYATPRMVMIDGERGRFFSKRLHHALVRFVTRNGSDLTAVEKILTGRFGCSTIIADYGKLTAPTTAEDAGRFMQFHPEELVQIINMFEEMPDGFHKVAGLKYLVRRAAGFPHPWYPQSAAVAWALPDLFPDGSYIEFMDAAFMTDLADMHRLLLHEKAHFLWGYVFSQKLRDDWIKLGGWYPDPADPDGWSTTKTTEFVSAYAHKKNPNEDMAESLAFFVLDPAASQSRAMEKYEFLRDRVMQGTRYITRIQQDLTFEVLDLFPDYEYPGKIRQVDITVDGAPEEDKVVTVEINLLTADRVFAGASNANMRIFSSINTWKDLWLFPTDATGATLRGQVTFSKYAKNGFWMTDEIVVTDNLGNQRMEGVHDYGWKLYLNNPKEDLVAPVYVPGSLKIDRKDDVMVASGISHNIQRVDVTWQAVEVNPMDAVYAKLTNPSAINFYPLESYGTYDAATSTASVEFVITEFMAPGTWDMPYLSTISDFEGLARGKNEGIPDTRSRVV